MEKKQTSKDTNFRNNKSACLRSSFGKVACNIPQHSATGHNNATCVSSSYEICDIENVGEYDGHFVMTVILTAEW